MGVIPDCRESDIVKKGKMSVADMTERRAKLPRSSAKSAKDKKAGTDDATEKIQPVVIPETDKRIIVLAKLEDRENLIKRGRTDIGELHKFETVYIPVAVIWLNEGAHEDVAAAKVYALKNNYRVLCYPLSEADPLGRAKTDIYGSLDWTVLEHLR